MSKSSREVCAIDTNFDISCYSHKNLKLIAKAYNKDHTSGSIKDSDKLSKKDLWQALNERITECDNEKCWLKYIKKVSNADLEKISDETFKVDDPNGELMTDIINRVMRQCERKYKNFTFLNALPSDAHNDRVLKAYSPTKSRKNMKVKPLIGIIFNNEPHTSDGEHWIGFFIDNEKKTVEYFDSLAGNPVKDILLFLKKYYPNYKIKKNSLQHQYGGVDCGLYCIEFIVRRLEGETFEQINSKRMLLDRKKYFS